MRMATAIRENFGQRRPTLGAFGSRSGTSVFFSGACGSRGGGAYDSHIRSDLMSRLAHGITPFCLSPPVDRYTSNAHEMANDTLETRTRSRACGAVLAGHISRQRFQCG